jgi:alpha-1,2-mannosyltransferase
VNAPYPVVLDWLSKASIGLSTMIDEHFGINVVEFMVNKNPAIPKLSLLNLRQAAGVIPVSHASGGPLNDIIVPFNGERTGKVFCLDHCSRINVKYLRLSRNIARDLC